MKGISRAVQGLNVGVIGSNVVMALVKRAGATTEAEAIQMIGENGTPRTLKELRELAELATSGPMRTDLYYRWASAIRDTESTWSVTPAGRAALRHAQTAGGHTP